MTLSEWNVRRRIAVVIIFISNSLSFSVLIFTLHSAQFFLFQNLIKMIRNKKKKTGKYKTKTSNSLGWGGTFILNLQVFFDLTTNKNKYGNRVGMFFFIFHFSADKSIKRGDIQSKNQIHPA